MTCDGLQQCAWLAKERAFGALKERSATSCYVPGREHIHAFTQQAFGVFYRVGPFYP